METQVEELFVLRLPPRLAARIGARIDKHDRSRGDPSALLRKHRRKHRDAKDEARQTHALIQAIWGEDGILDYDSLHRAEDLLYLDSLLTGEDEQGADVEDEDKDGDAQTPKEDRDADADEADDAGDCDVEYWQVEGRNYIFKYGEDEYYATLVNLPCIIEAQKTVDNANLYKTGDIGQMLIVHDVKSSSGLPRPEIPESDLHEGTYAHGLTPPMRRVLPDRFVKVSAAARRQEQGLTMEEVREADDLLFQFKELVLQKHKKIDAPAQAKAKRMAAAAAAAGPGAASVAAPGSTVFVYEEVINAEPWMESAEDVIIVEPGDDKFMSSMKKAKNRAMENKSMMDERRKNAPKQAATTIPSGSNNGGSNPGSQPVFDPIAALRGGSIGVTQALTSSTISPVPTVSLTAPPNFGSVPAMSLAAPPLPATTNTKQPSKQDDSLAFTMESPGASGGDVLL